MGFLFCRLGHAPGVGLGGAWAAQGVKKFERGHVAYLIGGDDAQNASKILNLGSNW